MCVSANPQPGSAQYNQRAAQATAYGFNSGEAYGKANQMYSTMFPTPRPNTHDRSGKNIFGAMFRPSLAKRTAIRKEHKEMWMRNYASGNPGGYRGGNIRSRPSSGNLRINT